MSNSLWKSVLAHRLPAATVIVTGVVSSVVLGFLALGQAPTASAVGCSAGAFAGGSGTASDPYQVSNAAQLAAVANCLDKAFLQTADITLTGAWTPIGESVSAYPTSTFRGTYDGGCHTITGLSVTSAIYEAELGLFGYAKDATLKNIRLVSVSLTGSPSGSDTAEDQYLGGLAGQTENSTISGVSVSGTVTSTGDNTVAAMLVGADDGTSVVTHVTTSGSVSSTGPVGGSSQGAAGLIGYGPKSLTESYSSVNVTGDQRVGGLIADTASATGITFQNNYSTGSVTGTGVGEDGVGGLIGEASKSLTITNSYAAGVNTPGTGNYGGGLVGWASYGGSGASVTYASSVWDSAATTQAYTAKVGYLINSGSSGVVGNGSSVTYEVSAGLVPAVGDTAFVTGATTAGYNGTFTVASATASSFTVASTATGPAGPPPGGNIEGYSMSAVGAKPTADMKTNASTSGAYAGWSTSVWNISDGAYPTLKWFTDGGLTTCTGGGGGGGGGSGGGGSGGGGSSSPSEEPVASPAASPSPSATAPVLPTLDPILNGQNRNVPASLLAPGQRLLLVNGQPTPVTVAPDAATDPTGLEITGPGFTMRLAGRGDQNDPLGLTDQQVLILQSQGGQRSGLLRTSPWKRQPVVQPVARTSGTGFMAASPVKLFLLPSTYLGTVQTDASGSFTGQVPIPRAIAPGGYTLQANGYSPQGQVRSLSIGVIVRRPEQALTRARAVVYFEPLSAALSKAGKKELRSLVRTTGKQGVRNAVVGYVQPTSTTENDQSLSTRRARKVARFLRSLGLTGVYLVRGDGVAQEYGATARRVNVTVSYRR